MRVLAGALFTHQHLWWAVCSLRCKDRCTLYGYAQTSESKVTPRFYQAGVEVEVCQYLVLAVGLQAGPGWPYWQQIQQTALTLHPGLREIQNMLTRWWWQWYFVGKMYIAEYITYIFHDHRCLNIISWGKLYCFEAISSCCRCSFSISVSITLSGIFFPQYFNLH